MEHSDESSASAAAEDGAGLPARSEMAAVLMADERDREQSLNTRAIAVGVAAFAAVALVSPVLASAVDAHRAPAAHGALVVVSCFIGLSAAVVVLVAITLVLMPSERQGLGLDALERWLAEDGMTDDETAARYEILDGLKRTITSRRSVNKSKAFGLRWAYRAFLLEVASVALFFYTYAIA